MHRVTHTYTMYSQLKLSRVFVMWHLCEEAMMHVCHSMFFVLILQESVTLGQFCDFLMDPSLKYEECVEV